MTVQGFEPRPIKFRHRLSTNWATNRFCIPINDILLKFSIILRCYGWLSYYFECKFLTLCNQLKSFWICLLLWDDLRFFFFFTPFTYWHWAIRLKQFLNHSFVIKMFVLNKQMKDISIKFTRLWLSSESLLSKLYFLIWLDISHPDVKLEQDFAWGMSKSTSWGCKTSIK